MASIQNEIERIGKAVYGEEVRKSICDGLQKINDDNNKYNDIKKTIEEEAQNVRENVFTFHDDIERATELIQDLHSAFDSTNNLKSELSDATTQAQSNINELKEENNRSDKSLDLLKIENPRSETNVSNLEQSNTKAEETLNSLNDLKAWIDSKLPNIGETLDSLQTSYQNVIDALDVLQSSEQSLARLETENDKAKALLDDYQAIKDTLPDLEERLVILNNSIEKAQEILKSLESLGINSLEDFLDRMDKMEANVDGVQEFLAKSV